MQRQACIHVLQGNLLSKDSLTKAQSLDAINVEEPTLASLKKLSKILHIHQQWQDLIYRGTKTWELSNWAVMIRTLCYVSLMGPQGNHNHMLPQHGH